MKIDSKEILAKLQSYTLILRKYVVFIYVVVLMIIFSFFIFRINQINSAEPQDTQIEEKLQTVQRPKIDQTVLDKIEQLQGQNVEVQALFDQARNNPFSE